MMKFLISQKADIQAASVQKTTALLAASSHGKLEAVKLLVENHADINANLEGGSNALHLAVCNGNLETVEYLLNYISIESQGKLGMYYHCGKIGLTKLLKIGMNFKISRNSTE